jgi:hypothetical protein
VAHAITIIGFIFLFLQTQRLAAGALAGALELAFAYSH